MSAIEFNKVFAVSELKEVLLHSKNYFTANIATKALALISLPILTAILTPSEYGTYQVFLSYTGILGILLTLNFNGSVARYYYDKTDDFGQFLSTSLLGSLLILGIFICLAVVNIEYVVSIVQLPRELVFLLTVFLVTNVFYSTFSHVNIAQSNSARLSRLNVFKSYLAFLAGLSMVLMMEEEKYRGLVYAEIITGLVVAVYCFISLSTFFKISLRLSHVKYVLGYSVPLIPYILSGVVLGQIDRIMINNYFGANEVGLYSIAFNIGALLTMVVAALNTAFTPKWFELKNSGNKHKVDKLEANIHVIVLFCGAGLVLFSDELFLVLINDAFHVSMHIVPVIVLAYVFESVFKAYGRVIGHTKKMIYMSLIGIFGALINVLLNYVYIPVYGYEAGAITTLVAFIVMLLTSVYIAKYRLKQKTIPLLRFIKPILLFIGLIVLEYWVTEYVSSYMTGLSIKIALFAVVCYLFYKHMKSGAFAD